jgi:hypothetical protein
VNSCVGALQNAVCVNVVKEILIEVAKSDVRSVVNSCVGALQNTDRVNAAKEILIEIAKSDARSVVNSCVGALQNTDRVNAAKEILIEVAKDDLHLVISMLTILLKDENIRPVCEEMLVQLVCRHQLEACNILAEWTNKDEFDRTKLIERVIGAAAVIELRKTFGRNSREIGNDQNWSRPRGNRTKETTGGR